MIGMYRQTADLLNDYNLMILGPKTSTLWGKSVATFSNHAWLGRGESETLFEGHHFRYWCQKY